MVKCCTALILIKNGQHPTTNGIFTVRLSKSKLVHVTVLLIDKYSLEYQSVSIFRGVIQWNDWYFIIAVLGWSTKRWIIDDNNRIVFVDVGDIQLQEFDKPIHDIRRDIHSRSKCVSELQSVEVNRCWHGIILKALLSCIHARTKRSIAVIIITARHHFVNSIHVDARRDVIVVVANNCLGLVHLGT